MVAAANPLSENVVAAVVVIWLLLEGVNPEVVLRNTSYCTPAGVLAFQARLIWLEETLVAVRPVGAAGGGTAPDCIISIPRREGKSVGPGDNCTERIPCSLDLPVTC